MISENLANTLKDEIKYKENKLECICLTTNSKEKEQYDQFIDHIIEKTNKDISKNINFLVVTNNNEFVPCIEKLRALSDIADSIGVSMSQLAIAWTIVNPNVTTAILGATNEQQLKENLSALDVVPKLTSEVMEKIEGILQNKPRYIFP